MTSVTDETCLYIEKGRGTTKLSEAVHMQILLKYVIIYIFFNLMINFNDNF
jgi:hypothetical protein